jgi:Fe-S cluster assembly iron-binding protein IscA
MNSWLAECRNHFNPTGARRLLRMFGMAQQPRFAEVCAGEEASPDAVRHYQLLEAVMQVRQIIAECNLPSGVYLRILTARVGNRLERSMKFSVDPPDVSRDLRRHYEGFDLVTDIESAANLTGVVLDFRKGIEGPGFVFRDA